MPTLDPNAPDFTRRYPNLADPHFDVKVILATDEFFVPKDRMLSPEPVVFTPDKYDDHSKWTDGWETRRRRSNDYDHCIIRLARSGVVKGVDIDTSHFMGNLPPAAPIKAAYLPDGEPTDATRWTETVPSTTLQDNSHAYVAVTSPQALTHLWLNISPDGGITCLRVHDQSQVDWKGTDHAKLIGLTAMESGAYVVEVNNEHFEPASRMLVPGRGVSMGDGREARHRRKPGNDWCVIALASPGHIRKIEVDTVHFKGNFADRVSIQTVHVVRGTDNLLEV